MRFKNPYSDPTLSDIEKDFLKKILFEFNKIRFNMKGLTWEYSGINDKKLLEDIKKKTYNYFDVPLEKASKATRRAKLTNGIKEFGKRWG